MNGTIIRDYGYFADIMATCVELSGAEYPKIFKGNDITPMEGISLVPDFTGGKTDRGETFWEHEANIAVRDGKWKLVLKTGEGNVYDPSKCELYDMEKDPTELHDLAGTDPERLERMFSDWQAWARKVNCMPLDTRFYDKRADDYRRTINGSFDLNLGGWVCVSDGSSKVEYSIDTENVISKPRTARADISAPGEKAGDAAMRWRFPPCSICSTSRGCPFARKTATT